MTCCLLPPPWTTMYCWNRRLRRRVISPLFGDTSGLLWSLGCLPWWTNGYSLAECRESTKLLVIKAVRVSIFKNWDPSLVVLVKNKKKGKTALPPLHPLVRILRWENWISVLTVFTTNLDSFSQVHLWVLLSFLLLAPKPGNDSLLLKHKVKLLLEKTCWCSSCYNAYTLKYSGVRLTQLCLNIRQPTTI